MRINTRARYLFTLFVCIACSWPCSVFALQAQTDDTNEPSLRAKQLAIAGRYQRFEQLLLQLAEYMRKTDPEKAELLVRAIGQSKEGRISQQMSRVAGLLEGESYGDALERQDELVGNLMGLLQLLQSEDRRNEVQDEIQRLEQVVKDLRKVIGQQKVTRATTERGGNPRDAQNQQEKVEKNTQRLIDNIKEHDKQTAEENGEQSESKPGEPSENRANRQNRNRVSNQNPNAASSPIQSPANSPNPNRVNNQNQSLVSNLNPNQANSRNRNRASNQSLKTANSRNPGNLLAARKLKKRVTKWNARSKN